MHWFIRSILCMEPHSQVKLSSALLPTGVTSHARVLLPRTEAQSASKVLLIQRAAKFVGGLCPWLPKTA